MRAYIPYGDAMTDVSKRALWAAYVRRIAGHLKQKEIEVHIDATLRIRGPRQATISRWLSAGSMPDKAADIAAFARAFDRNPLEAFVAASLLTEDEAGRGLDDDSRTLLAELKGRSHRPRSNTRDAG